MTRKNKMLLTGTIFFIVILITSCADLSAVRDWSKKSFEATQYNELITTYADTPQRIKRYELWCDQSAFCQKQIDEKNKINVPNKLTREQILKLYDDQIILRNNQKEAFQSILVVISHYMATLAILSADSTVDYKKDVETLTKTIGKLNTGISQDTLGAAGTLIDIVFGKAAKAYQAKQVADIIEKANPPLQTILNSELRHVINIDFRRDLMIEKSWIDQYYDYLLQKDCTSTYQVKDFKLEKIEKYSKYNAKQPSTNGNCLSDAINISIEEWKEERLNENAKRISAVDAYLIVLDNLTSGHKKLYDNRNNLDTKQLIEDLYLLIIELQKQIKTLAQS